MWLCIVMFSSCRKTTLLDREYLIFGESFSECDGDCSHFLFLEETKVYRDHFNSMVTTIHNRTFKTVMTFDRQQLSDEKFKIANWTLDNFPEYLKNNPGQTFGFPDARDQGEIYIELKQKGKKAIKWRIDREEGSVPAEIQCYIKQMKEIISKVYF